MKYILPLLILLSLLTPLFAKDIVLKNNDISVTLSIIEKNPYVSQIRDVKNKVDFIPDCQYTTPLWSFTCIKDKDYNSEPIILTPTDAESIEYNITNSKAQITWLNVKNSAMSSAFNVTVTIDIEKENSYWHIVISKNDEYGLTTVTFPRIDNISTKDTYALLPFRGGAFYKDFDSHHIYPMNNHINMASVTKGNSTLYLSPEDEKVYSKKLTFKSSNALNMLIEIKSDLEHSGEAGYGYSQPFKYNIAIIEGDWYDACKKFRNWGIEHKFGVFANGRLDERKDIPKWWLENTAWFTCDEGPREETEAESILKAYKMLGVPCAVHFYLWPEYHMDTHYPNFLPARDTFKENVKKLQNEGLKIFPYTNGYLVDTNQAPIYKELGDVLVTKNEKDEINFSSEWDIAGSVNAVACIGEGAYSDFLVKELCEIVKEIGVDGIYLDQVGASPYKTCFNKEHNHPLGGGDWWVAGYRNLIKEIKEKAEKIKGEPIVIYTEDSADSYNFDGWLRCSDAFINNTDTPANTVIYSGYGISIGDRFYQEEYDTEDAIAVVNKLAIDLTKGIQPGWGIGRKDELIKYPKIGKYYPTMAKARYKAYEFFNLGEMVRNVNIENQIPTINLIYKSFLDVKSKDFPTVRTCSYNYKEKACVVFTNISDNEQEIKWSAKPSDLNLKKKPSYKISAFYPEGSAKTVKSIRDTFTIKGNDTIIFVVE